MRETFIQNREYFYRTSFKSNEGYKFLKEFFKNEKRDIDMLLIIISFSDNFLNELFIFIEKRLNVNILHKDNIILKVY